MDKVNLAQKFSMFNDYWSPKIVGEINDSYVKLVKFKGEFVWHEDCYMLRLHLGEAC